MKNLWSTACAFVLPLLFAGHAAAELRVTILNSSPEAEFAVAEIRAAAADVQASGNWQITLSVLPEDNTQLQPEGFQLTPDHGARHVRISAIDPAGLAQARRFMVAGDDNDGYLCLRKPEQLVHGERHRAVRGPDRIEQVAGVQDQVGLLLQ